MSFWLSQFHNVLNKLDDHVETVAETVAEEGPDVVTSTAARMLRTTWTASNVSKNDVVKEADDEEYFESEEIIDEDEGENGFEDGTYPDEKFMDEMLDDMDVENVETIALDDNVERTLALPKPSEAVEAADAAEISPSQDIMYTEATEESVTEDRPLKNNTIHSYESDGKADLETNPIQIESKSEPDGTQNFEDIELVETKVLRESCSNASSEMIEKQTDDELDKEIATSEIPPTTITSVEAPPAQTPQHPIPSNPDPEVAESSDITTATSSTTTTTTNNEVFHSTDAHTLPGSNAVGRIQNGGTAVRSKTNARDSVIAIKNLKSALATTQAEVIKLQKDNMNLEKQLHLTQIEIQAHLDELSRAARSMESERAKMKLKRDEIMEKNQDDIRKLRADYEKKLSEQKELYEQKISGLQDRFAREQATRNHEYDENAAELTNALVREKEALDKIVMLHSDKYSLESMVTKLESQQEALQKQVASLLETSKAASTAQEEAERKLDEALTSHKRQLQQRLNRENELERTIADLVAALTAAQQEIANTSATTRGKSINSIDELDNAQKRNDSYIERYEVAMEELDTLKAQLSLTTSRCDALQKEVTELTAERVKEAASIQKQILDYEEKIQKLVNSNNRLEVNSHDYNNKNSGSLDGDDITSKSCHSDIPSSPLSLQMNISQMSGSSSADDRIRVLMADIEQGKRQIVSLSDQLIRQQSLSEKLKSELFTLKARLQAATARAETAEQQLQNHLLMQDGEGTIANGTDLELAELGGTSVGEYPVRRRMKVGSKNRYNYLPIPSIRAAVGLRNAPGTERHLTRTIDILDTWMLEGGALLRHEPLARLGFGLYLIVLHTWCFALFSYHTVQAEMHDLRPIPLLVSISPVTNTTTG